MKTLIFIMIILSVVLIGTFPLSILAKIFEYIAIAINWLADILNIFGWNGILKT